MNEQQPQNTGSGNKAIVIVVIVLVILAFLGIAGYLASKYVFQKAGQAIVNNAVNSTKTNESDTASLNLGNESVKTGNLASWPTDFPFALQPPEDVQIYAVTKNTASQIWTITIKEIPTNAISNYVETLKDEGWQVANENNVLVQITELTKDSWKLNIAYDEPNRSALLTVSPK